MRVLVTRHLFPEAIEHLQQGVDVEYHDCRDGMTQQELCTAVQGQDAVICPLTDRIGASVIAASDKLRLIANVAVGYDNIDLATATAAGVMVTNTPGVLTESTADLTFALLMATARRLGEAERFLRRGAWKFWEIDLLAGRDIHGQTLGVLGMGRIGQAVARRAQGFGMRVLYHNRSKVEAGVEEALAATYVSMEELLERSDFLTVHVPLDDVTRAVIGPAELARMRPGTILINTARGPVLDTDAVIAALESGHLGGVGLDVFDDEPAVDSRLLSFENAVLLPHIGSASTETRRQMCMLAVENVLAHARGDRPPHLVNPSALA